MGGSKQANPSWGPGPGPHLNGSGGSGAAGPDLEEASTGRGRLTTLAGCAALVDDHRFPTKQAHEVSGLLALDHTALAGQQDSKSGRRAGASVLLCGSKLTPPPQQCGLGASSRPGHHAGVCTPSTQELGGNKVGVPGKLETAPLPHGPQALPWLLSPPMRTCLSDPESSPRIREPMFANIPLNRNPWVVRGHSFRMVTSAQGMKDGRVVRIELSRYGETPLAQPEEPPKPISPFTSHLPWNSILFCSGLRSILTMASGWCGPSENLLRLLSLHSVPCSTAQCPHPPQGLCIYSSLCL